MPDHTDVVFPMAAQPPADIPAPPLPLPVQPFVDELYHPPVVRPTAQEDGAQLGVWMHPARAQFHAELPTTTAIWTYTPSAEPPDDPQPPLGPIIEVQQRQRVQIAWHNVLTGPDGGFAPHPVVAVRDLPARVQLASTSTPAPTSKRRRLISRSVLDRAEMFDTEVENKGSVGERRLHDVCGRSTMAIMGVVHDGSVHRRYALVRGHDCLG